MHIKQMSRYLPSQEDTSSLFSVTGWFYSSWPGLSSHIVKPSTIALTF